MDLRTFDRDLDPEQRLRLQEIGLEHLNAVDDLTATTAAPGTTGDGVPGWVEVS